ncbi:MAG: hypothetical protein KC486_29690, partial [Myxococcales bacterium]|nr:hypothetical protein [Myxococcales bacterium]
MNTQQSLSSLLSLATVLTLAPALVACDGVEVDGELIDELDDGVEMRSGAAVQSTKWRIRNAAPQQNSGQWVLREMDFCADPECTQPLNGLAIDSGASKSWSAPANAFDNNTSTLWKTFDASVAGQSWIGLEFPQPVAVGGIYLKTDNVVYSVGAIFVEYWDANTNTWVTADFIGKLPAGAELHRDVEIRDTFPIKWRIRNAAAQGNSGQIVLREMDFCADADCATPLTDGTAIDSGASKSWSLPENAFDDDTSTLWKTFDADVAGQSYIGMDYGDIRDIAGLYLKTDNVVYSVDSYYVEYYDVIAQDWVVADLLSNVPSSSELTLDVAVRDRFPTAWRVRNAVVQANSGQIVLREMDFCADADCATPLAGGTAIDSGA